MKTVITFVRLSGATALKRAAPSAPKARSLLKSHSAGDNPDVPKSLSRGWYLGKFIHHNQQRVAITLLFCQVEKLAKPIKLPNGFLTSYN